MVILSIQCQTGQTGSLPQYSEMLHAGDYHCTQVDLCAVLAFSSYHCLPISHRGFSRQAQSLLPPT